MFLGVVHAVNSRAAAESVIAWKCFISIRFVVYSPYLYILLTQKTVQNYTFFLKYLQESVKIHIFASKLRYQRIRG
jgi:hypothetical protein